MMKLTLSTRNVFSEGNELQIVKTGVNDLAVTQGDTTVFIGAVMDKPFSGSQDSKPAHVICTYMDGETATIKILRYLESVGSDHLYEAEMIEKKKSDVISFSLIGGFSVYAGKKDAVDAIEKLNRITIELKLIDDKVIGFYQGKEVGYIKSKSDEYETLVEHLEDLITLSGEADKADKGTIYGKIRFGIMPASTHKVSLPDEFDRIILEGIDTKENLDEKLKYLQDNKVSKVAIANLFATYRKYPVEVAGRILPKPNTVFVDTSGIVEEVIPSANEGKHLGFEGEKGVGKNVLTETMSWLYSRPLYEFSFNSAQSNNALLGGKTFANEKEDNKEEKKELVKSALAFLKIAKKSLFKGSAADHEDTELEKAQSILYKALGKNDKTLVFEMSSILEAMVNGGILVVDEFNTAQPSILSIFNSLLDDRGRMEVTGLGQITKSENFMAISTQNRDYEGTFELNEATADRFEPVLFPAPNNIVEVLQARVPGMAYDTALQCNKLYMGIRASVMDPDSEIDKQALTIRGFVSACEVNLRQGVALKKALLSHVANRVKDEDSRDAVKSMIDMQLG